MSIWERPKVDPGSTDGRSGIDQRSIQDTQYENIYTFQTFDWQDLELETGLEVVAACEVESGSKVVLNRIWPKSVFMKFPPKHPSADFLYLLFTRHFHFELPF